MKKSNMLRWCVALEWVFGLSGVVAYFALESSLPQPLAAWLKAEAERDMTTLEMATVPVFLLFLVSYVVATVGLFRLRRWAAWLYLISCIGVVILTPLTGPTVQHALAQVLNDIAGMLSGMVIALAFFTDSLKEKDELNPPSLPDPQGI